MKKFVVCKECIDDLKFLRHYKKRPLKLTASADEDPTSKCINNPTCFDQPERLKNREIDKDVGL